jgi:hypothetical protein
LLKIAEQERKRHERKRRSGRSLTNLRTLPVCRPSK